MTDENDKLGTPDPQAADASEDTSTSRAEGEDGQGGLSAEDTEKLHLTWKAKAEKAEAAEARAAEAERELADLRARQQQPPAAADTDGDGDDDAELEQIRFFAQDRVNENGQIVKGDPVAKRLLKQIERDKQVMAAWGFKDELEEIDDKVLRVKVREHFIKARSQGRPLPDIAAARAEVERDIYAAEKAALQKQLADSVVRANPDVIRTEKLGVPASQAKARTMTQADWDRTQAELLERANAGDVAASKERMRQQLERRKPQGAIRVKD